MLLIPRIKIRRLSGQPINQNHDFFVKHDTMPQTKTGMAARETQMPTSIKISITPITFISLHYLPEIHPLQELQLSFFV